MGRRLVLWGGIVGDHDGAYDWVRPNEENAPENTLGRHESSWPDDSYTVVEIAELITQAAEQRAAKERQEELVYQEAGRIVSRVFYRPGQSPTAKEKLLTSYIAAALQLRDEELARYKALAEEKFPKAEGEDT